MRYSGDFVTLPTVLKDAGYKTAAFVSGFSVTSDSSGLDIGFDLYDETWSETQLERDASEAIQACTDWIQENSNSDKPYFIWLHLFDPHTPYLERFPYYQAISGITEKVEKPIKQQYTEQQKKKYQKNVDNALKKRKFKVLVKHPMTVKTDPETFKKKWAAYLSEVSYVDERLNEFRRSMERMGQWPKTLVLITSDHGEGFDHDYYYGHGDRLWESSIHVPWMVRLPLDREKGKIGKAIVRHVDIFPTIMSYCNVEFPIPGLEGQDLKNTIQLNLAGRTSSWTAVSPPLPREEFSQGLVTCAFNPHFKLIRTESKPNDSLFFLTRDPAELIDVSEQYPEIKDTLVQQVDRLISRGRIPKANSITDNESDQSEQLRALGYIQ
jgi:arylsulfatase A-like enzyme